MKALLWKDYRANRQVLIVGLTLLVAPYAILVGWLWYSVGLGQAGPSEWAHCLSSGAHGSLAASQLTILLLAGTIIAGERRDRSAEFLAYLPPSRPLILASKSLLCAATIIVIWGLALAVFGLAVPSLNPELAEGPDHQRLGEFLLMLATSGAALFGVAWLGSSILESPTYATAIGLVTVILVPFLLNGAHTLFGWPARELGGNDFVRWLHISYVGVGAAGYLAGWAYYVRRVEP